MTGISHLYKDKHQYIQTLINDLYGNLKLAIKNLKINLNPKRHDFINKGRTNQLSKSDPTKIDD